MAVFDVLRRGQQRCGPAADEPAQLTEGGFGVGAFELVFVARDERVVASRVMAVPAPQLRRRSDVFAPPVDARIVPADAPGPEPVDQYPQPVVRLWWVVDSGQPHHHPFRHPGAGIHRRASPATQWGAAAASSGGPSTMM